MEFSEVIYCASTDGGPEREFPYLSEFPRFVYSLIDNYMYPRGDSNYGFKVVSYFGNGDVEKWGYST